MTIDALLVTLLANTPSILFGLTGALILFRVSSRPTAGGSYLGGTTRLAMRLGAAVLVFSALVGGWNSAAESIGRRMRPSTAASGEARIVNRAGMATGMQGVRAAAEIVAARTADDPQQARQRFESAIRVMRAQGMEESDIREVVVEIAGSAADRPWMRAVADSVLAGAGTEAAEAALPADSLALAYAEAVSTGDSSAAQSLRPQLARALAGDTLRDLGAELRSVQQERAELSSRVESLEEEAKRELGWVDRIGRLEDELGWGLWSGLYFTATLAMWKGRTPGKRLLGIRVLRLNGKPIGWWAAFERFGGYAAGIATGLLGFVQIFWDRNRQATHDKISETVVVRD